MMYHIFLQSYYQSRKLLMHLGGLLQKWIEDTICLADSQVRDINGYHEKFDAGLLDEDKFDRFPYIVVFIDELNDLMMVAVEK